LVDFDFALQLLKDRVESAVVVPLVEQTPNRLPRAECGRQVTPRRPRAQDPEYAIHHRAPISGRATGDRRRIEQVRDSFPLLIREPMSKHDELLSNMRFMLTSATISP
jgi:hypothetical protein